MPVSSYPSELIELWRRAADEEISLPMPDETAAQHLRFQLYSVRKEMRKEFHPLVDLAEKAEIVIQKQTEVDGQGREERVTYLRIRPKGSAFLDTLRAAGIDPRDSAPDVTVPELEQGGDEKSAIDPYKKFMGD